MHHEKTKKSRSLRGRLAFSEFFPIFCAYGGRRDEFRFGKIGDMLVCSILDGGKSIPESPRATTDPRKALEECLNPWFKKKFLRNTVTFNLPDDSALIDVLKQGAANGKIRVVIANSGKIEIKNEHSLIMGEGLPTKITKMIDSLNREPMSFLLWPS